MKEQNVTGLETLDLLMQKRFARFLSEYEVMTYKCGKARVLYRCLVVDASLLKNECKAAASRKGKTLTNVLGLQELNSGTFAHACNRYVAATGGDIRDTEAAKASKYGLLNLYEIEHLEKGFGIDVEKCGALVAKGLLTKHSDPVEEATPAVVAKDSISEMSSKELFDLIASAVAAGIQMSKKDGNNGK